MFSVVIPVYNKKPHVSKAITSVLKQDYDNFEIIVVCDPSTDGSEEEVNKFKDSRVRVVYRKEPGPGGYAARNLGVALSRYDWVCFLDADDEWLPNHLQVHHNLIKETGYDVVATSWFDVYEEGDLPSNKKSVCNKNIYKLDFVGFLQNYSTKTKLVHTNTITMKKRILSSFHGFPEGTCRRGGDVATWINAVSYSKGIAWLNYETAYYHRENSTVIRETPPEVEENCVFICCANLIKQKSASHMEIKALRRLSNKHVLSGLINKSAQGNLTRGDLKFFYVEGNFLLWCFFITYSALPSSTQSKLWSFYRKMKI